MGVAHLAVLSVTESTDYIYTSMSRRIIDLLCEHHQIVAPQTTDRIDAVVVAELIPCMFGYRTNSKCQAAPQ